MLKKLITKNFRKLRAAEIHFEQGINVMRGENEAGKSTLLEAIGYALFGVSVCRESLDDLVTWGEPVSSLKVELTINVDGVDYLVKRSKAGAEVWYSGRAEPDVVGQKEVGEFVSRLLGMDGKSMAKLILAGQGAIRGALDEGPAATIELIEQLAELDQLDQLLQLITEHLPNGPVVGVEQRINQLTDQQSNLPSISTDQIETLRLWLPDAEAAVQAAQAKKAAALQAIEYLKHKQQELAARQRAVAQADSRINTLKPQVQTRLTELANLQAAAGVARKDVDGLRARLKEAEEYDELSRARAVFLQLPALPEVHWEGGLDDLGTELSTLRAQIKQHEQRQQTLSREVAVLQSQLVTSSVCGFCSLDVSQFPEVATKNAERTAQIEAKQAEAAALVGQLAEARSDVTTLETLITQDNKVAQALARIERFVQVSFDTVPRTARWSGPEVPLNLPDSEGLRREIRAAEEHNRGVDVAAAKVEPAQRALADMQKQLADAQAERDALPDVVDEVGLQTLATQAEVTFSAAGTEVTEAQQALRDLSTRLAQAEANAEAAKRMAAQLDEQLKAARTELEEIQFNNELIKAIRAARPVIAEKVWNMVLGAVSTFFSSMRGEDSLVERKGKSFLVNGKGVPGLSGSTKDVLGLAIRLALTATFLPTARFLVLDEPWAACDAERSQRCLGFLQTTGMDQILLVTHEDASEAVADHLITL